MYTYSEFRGAPNARGGNYYHKTRQDVINCMMCCLA